MRHRLLAASLGLAVPGCAGIEALDESASASTTGTIQLNLLYLHGV